MASDGISARWHGERVGLGGCGLRQVTVATDAHIYFIIFGSLCKANHQAIQDVRKLTIGPSQVALREHPAILQGD